MNIYTLSGRMLAGRFREENSSPMMDLTPVTGISIVKFTGIHPSIADIKYFKRPLERERRR
jgi:hypothetical protein